MDETMRRPGKSAVAGQAADSRPRVAPFSCAAPRYYLLEVGSHRPWARCRFRSSPIDPAARLNEHLGWGIEIRPIEICRVEVAAGKVGR